MSLLEHTDVRYRDFLCENRCFVEIKMHLKNTHTPEGSENQSNSNNQNCEEDLEQQPPEQNAVGIEDQEDQPQREITQTDHLNRRLLDSFLLRLNQPNSSIPQTDPIDCSSQDFEPEGTDPASSAGSGDNDPQPLNPEA